MVVLRPTRESECYLPPTGALRLQESLRKAIIGIEHLYLLPECATLQDMSSSSVELCG